MRRRDSACRAHAAGLTALAAGREPVPYRTALVAHVDRCARCITELQELTLAVVALRRIGQMPEASSSMGASAWPRLRARIERSRESAAASAWRARGNLLGLAAGSLVVAALVAPQAVRLPARAAGTEPVGYSARELDVFGARIEQTYLFETRVEAVPGANVTWEPHDGFLMRYPDETGLVRKEVDLPHTGRPIARDSSLIGPS